MVFIIDLGIMLLTFFYQYKSKKDYKIPFYLAVILILTAGLRYNYKLDYNNYRIIFKEISKFNHVIYTAFEKGFAAFIFLFKKLGLGFYTFMLAIAATSVALKYKFFNKFSTIPMFSLLIYFLTFFIFNDMEQIRHGLAIAIALSSVVFVINDDFWKFAGVVLIASLIHYSAVLFLLLYFIRNISLNKKSFTSILLVSVLFSFIDFVYIIKFINDNFINSPYIDIKLNLYDGQSIGIISLTLLIRLTIALVYFIFVYNENNKQSRIFFNAYIVGICIFVIFRSTTILGIRSSAYFRYFELLLVPEYLTAVKNTLPKQKTSTEIFHYLFISGLIGYYIFKFIETLSKSNYFIYFSI